MATPNYKGQGQPAAASSGWLSALFGNRTPAYKSAPAQPAASAPSTSTASTASTTTSATAPAAAPAASATGCDANAPTQIAIVIPREVIER